MSFCSFAACKQGCTTSSSLINNSRIPLFSTTRAPRSFSSFKKKRKTLSSYELYIVLFKGDKEMESSLICVTSNSKVRRRILVANLEAWGRVAICLVHSDTVFVSLVVRGSAALINTSAASHTYRQHKYKHVCVGKQMYFKLVIFLNVLSFLFLSCSRGSIIADQLL